MDEASPQALSEPPRAGARVVQMPLRAAHKSAVVCELNGITFPAIYLVGRIVTKQDWIGKGLPAREPVAQFTYEFNPNQYEKIGRQAQQVIEHIDEHVPVSVLVRHHASVEVAANFLEAIRLMYCFENNGDTLIGARADREKNDELWGEHCCLEGEHFTMHAVPTHPSWPGDLLIFQCEVPDKRDAKMCQLWTRAVTTTGEWLAMDLGTD